LACIDLCSIYAAAVRRMLPRAVLTADLFHVVKLANRKIDEAFRRLGYRTEHPHEELGLPRPLHYMLRYNIENLSQDHLAVIIGVLDGNGDGQQIAAVWIAKEQLRSLLALRATRTHFGTHNMIGDRHGWPTGRGTLLVRAVDEILGTHSRTQATQRYRSWLTKDSS
jgi:hypothetical protein